MMVAEYPFPFSSLGGSYVGVEPMGLVWSMKLSAGQEKASRRLAKWDVTRPYVVNVDVLDGHSHPVEGGEGNAIVSGTFEKWYMKEGVRRIPVREGRIRGTLFLPPGDGPFPGILWFYGGVGRLLESSASLLASRGFAAMALAYFDHDDLPESSKDVDCEYFEETPEWLASRPEVSPQGLGALSLSIGTPFLFMLAIHKPALIKALVAISPFYGFAPFPLQCKGETLPAIDIDPALITRGEFGQISSKDCLVYDSPINQEGSRSLIPIEKVQCPVMLIYGEDDETSPTEHMVKRMTKRMAEHGKQSLCVSLGYPGAGHLFEPPYTPHCEFTIQKSEPFLGTLLALGGQSKAHNIAQENSWLNILSFFREHLANVPV